MDRRLVVGDKLRGRHPMSGEIVTVRVSQAWDHWVVLEIEEAADVSLVGRDLCRDTQWNALQWGGGKVL